MVIIAIIGLVVMGFILGIVFQKTDTCCELHGDYDIKSGKLSSFETRIFMLEQENQRINHIVNSVGGYRRFFEQNYFAHYNGCNKTFYSRDMKDNDVAKMLNDFTFSASEKIAEIAKKLGFDLK